MTTLWFSRALVTLALAAGGALAQDGALLEEFYQPYGAAVDPDKISTVTYEVQEGDTLFTIAEKLLGNPYRAELLAKLNGIDDPLRLKKGMKIKAPRPRPGLLLSMEKLDKEDGLIEVASNSLFAAGDRFRVRLTSNVDGYLYVYNQEANGDLKQIALEGGRQQKIVRFSEYVLPRDGAFRLDSAKGSEELLVLLSLQPLSGLDRDLVAESAAAKKVRSYAEGASAKGIRVASGGAPRSIVMSSPLEETTVVAHRLVLKRRN